MLSDGGMERVKSGKVRFGIALSGVEHLDWLNYIGKAVTTLGARVSPGYPKVWDRVSSVGTSYKYCFTRTLTCDFLVEQYEKWYKDGVKVVPTDIRLHPITIANWFMGDTTCGSGHGITLEFTTECFNEDGLLILEAELQTFGLELGRSNRPNGGHRITVRTRSVSTLVNMIKQHVLGSYTYKITSMMSNN